MLLREQYLAHSAIASWVVHIVYVCICMHILYVPFLIFDMHTHIHPE